MYRRVQAVYGVWSSALSGPEFQAVEREMAPRLAAFRDEIMQNEKLFQRIEAVYQAPDKDQLTPEQQRLVWLHYTEFVRAGAKLDEDAESPRHGHQSTAGRLFTAFSQNLLADEEQGATVLTERGGIGRSARFAARRRKPRPSAKA
jgi:peptidyl-dipeptidase Dcp